METFTALKDFVANPGYAQQRRQALSQIDLSDLDEPVRDIVLAFQALPHCFTLQCCWGHFLYDGQPDPHHIARLPGPESGIGQVEYRIAYLALCIQDSPAGQALFQRLHDLTTIDPAYVQFGCAEWFWERQVNSYVLQVEPQDQAYGDRAVVDYAVARRLEQARDAFFDAIRHVIRESGIPEGSVA